MGILARQSRLAQDNPEPPPPLAKVYWCISFPMALVDGDAIDRHSREKRLLV
jgi:hypothetical protein